MVITKAVITKLIHIIKRRELLIFLISILALSGFSQEYLLNPSFDGFILQTGPPADWDVCINGSTPNVQPGKYDVFLAPSDGLTYLGMLTRDNSTWEDIHSILNIPLSMDSCYLFEIDLAFWEFLSWTIVEPVVVKVYGGDTVCDKNNLLWTSPPISNEEWITYHFMIHNQDFDINDLILECYYTTILPYWGYVLLDNIRITTTPQFEFGNDSIISHCENDTIILDPGNEFAEYLWQDGTTSQTYFVDTTGLYWVQVFNEQGCSWTDSVYVTIEEYQAMISEMIDSTLVCEGQEVTITADISNGAEPYSYQWINFPDTTESLTLIVDSTSYYYVVVTDNCGFTLMDSIKIVMIDSPSPDIPGTPTGPESVCSNFTYDSEFETTGANYADSYIWVIYPAEAGLISGNGTTGTVIWTLNWEGVATIKVKGVNEDCGEGEFSDGFDVICAICTEIGETGDKTGILIYPNPTTGQFFVYFDYNNGSANITVTNLLGEIILEELTESGTGRSLNIDLSEYPEGIYFVKTKTDNSEQIKKVIIQ